MSVRRLIDEITPKQGRNLLKAEVIDVMDEALSRIVKREFRAPVWTVDPADIRALPAYKKALRFRDAWFRHINALTSREGAKLALQKIRNHELPDNAGG